MEVLYHIRPYFEGIFPYIGLIYGRYLQFRFLEWPLNQEMVIFHGINWGIRWDKFLKINWGHLHPTNIRLLIMVIFHGVSMVILVMGIQDVQ